MKVFALVSHIKAADSLIHDIENGVTGTLYNPSDCDLSPGRICYSDIAHAKGDDVARLWESTRQVLSTTNDKIYRMRSPEARSLYRSQMGYK